MTPAGYIAKKIHTSTDWLNNSAVEDIWSVSNCMSEVFCDYIPHWRHNGYWLFDTPGAIRDVATEKGIDLSACRMFYYEIHGQQYDDDNNAWETFGAESSLETRVQVPAEKQLEGFDVVSFSTQSAPECSPLSCNGLASTCAVNQHCLLASFEEAKQLIESRALENSEPGPFRIFAVYTFSE